MRLKLGFLFFRRKPMNILNKPAKNKLRKVMRVLYEGGQISVFTPYLMKHNIFCDKKGNALKFADEVIPGVDTFVEIGSYFSKGYEQGWMLDGVQCKDSMCSVSKHDDFVTRMQHTIKKIIEIDHINHSYKSIDEVQSCDVDIDINIFDCSFESLKRALKREKIAYTVSDSGTLTVVAQT